MKKHLLVWLSLLLIFLSLPAMAADVELTFSLPSGFYPDDMQLEIACSDDGATVYYTLDGAVPDEGSLVYAGPMSLTDSNVREDVLMKITGITGGETFVPDVDFPTGHVVRAVAIREDGARSAVVSGTFFIGYDRAALYGDIPIMLLVTDPRGLFDYDTGIYVNGRYHDEWKAQQTQPYEAWQVQGNYNLRGDEWERPVSVTYLSGDGTGFTQEMGLRIKGGATRNHNQKSLRLIAREQYGRKNVRYELFPDNLRPSDGGVVDKYKSFTLRNGGNDDEYAKIRDPFIKKLSAGLRFETAANQPCLAFLNGEYWGLYTLNEEYTDNYIQYHYGIDNENVIMVKCNELDEGKEEGDFRLYKEMYNFVAYADMSRQVNYEKACTMLDMGSFADYCAMQLYIANQDGIFHNNNWQMWRVREPDIGKHPYADGRWRMMAYDTDFSSGVYEDGQNSGWDNLAEVLASDYAGSHPARMFTSLIRHPDFRRQFVLACCDVRNLYFSRSRTRELLEEMTAQYQPYRADTLLRFGPSWALWDPEQHSLNCIGSLGAFFDARYHRFLTFVKRDLDLGTSCTITIHVSDPAKGTVYLNGRSVAAPHRSYHKYFADYPVTATAVPAEGAVFVGWEVSSEKVILSDPDALTTEITFSRTFTLTAVFE